MKISTRGRYALRMMVEFAMHPEQTTKLNHVSKNQGISEKYLEQIVSILTKAGLVKSIRGAQGGYMLTKTPREYSVGDILRLTEGGLVPADCLLADENFCERSSYCVTQNVFKKIEIAINEVVDHITLEDLLEDELSIKAHKAI